MKKVAVIMGSDSGLPVLKGALGQLKKPEIPFGAHGESAHRIPVEALMLSNPPVKRFRCDDCCRR